MTFIKDGKEYPYVETIQIRKCLKCDKIQKENLNFKQMKKNNEKLVVITRRDLSPGQQAIQAAHAAIEFQHEHFEIAKNWHINSKYLVFLSVENEEELKHQLEKIQNRYIKHSIFTEPDMGNQLTAIALEPG